MILGKCENEFEQHDLNHELASAIREPNAAKPMGWASHTDVCPVRILAAHVRIHGKLANILANCLHFYAEETGF